MSIVNALCKILGHKPPVYASDLWHQQGKEYGRITRTQTDGTGRIHACISANCARCGIIFHICRVHLPKEEDL